MTKIFILLILSYYSSSGKAAHSVEFNTEKACWTAAEHVKNSSKEYYTASCFPKD